jgi:hypothetical protein
VPQSILDIVTRAGFVPRHVWALMKSQSNRNEDDQTIINALLSRGLTAAQCKAVFLAFPCGEGVARKRKPDYYLDLSITKGTAVVRTIKPFKLGNQAAEVWAW